jgi:hypothetical protein
MDAKKGKDLWKGKEKQGAQMMSASMRLEAVRAAVCAAAWVGSCCVCHWLLHYCQHMSRMA